MHVPVKCVLVGALTVESSKSLYTDKLTKPLFGRIKIRFFNRF